MSINRKRKEGTYFQTSWAEGEFRGTTNPTHHWLKYIWTGNTNQTLASILSDDHYPKNTHDLHSFVSTFESNYLTSCGSSHVLPRSRFESCLILQACIIHISFQAWDGALTRRPLIQTKNTVLSRKVASCNNMFLRGHPFLKMIKGSPPSHLNGLELIYLAIPD